MKYHAPTDQFTVEASALRHAGYAFRNAIKHVRQQAGRDVAGYENPGAMDHAEHAEASIIDAALSLGIDLGANRPGKLNVSDA